MNPLVSICVPTYNGERFLGECLKSAIDQTYRPIEIILSDDESTDHTIALAESVLSKSAVPFKISNHQRTSIGDNWNNCINQANGDYIKFLFQDDKLTPDCLDRMMKEVQNNDQISFVFCNRIIINDGVESEQWTENWITGNSDLTKYWNTKLDNPISGNEVLKSITTRNIFTNIIGEPTAVLFQKSFITKHGEFDPELKQLLDLEAWLRFMRNEHLAFIKEPLVFFRLHDNQASFRNSNEPFPEHVLLKNKLLPQLKGYLNSRTFNYLKKYPKKTGIDWLITRPFVLFLRYHIGTLRLKIRRIIPVGKGQN